MLQLELVLLYQHAIMGKLKVLMETVSEDALKENFYIKTLVFLRAQ